MKKLSILVMCMVVSFSFAGDPVDEKLTTYKVTKTKITNVEPFCISIVEGNYEMVKKMIELGSKVNGYSHGMTPLMYAARHNKVEIAKLLIANGARIKSRNARGYNAMNYAELSHANDIIVFLKELKKK